MGRYCKSCKCERSWKGFGGAGICRACQQTPKKERQRRDQLQTLYDFLYQKNISRGNIKTLQQLALRCVDEEVLGAVTWVASLATLHPLRRRRWELIKRRPDIVEQIMVLPDWGAWLYAANLVTDYHLYVLTEELAVEPAHVLSILQRQEPTEPDMDGGGFTDDPFLCETCTPSSSLQGPASECCLHLWHDTDIIICV